MGTVFTWEMRSDFGRITYVLVDHVIFGIVRGSTVYVIDTPYDNAAEAREGAVRLTGHNEREGYTMDGGIWFCQVEVDIPELERLVGQGVYRKATAELEKIINAARIMGRQHR